MKRFLLPCLLAISLFGCADHPPRDRAATAEADIHHLLLGKWYEKIEPPGQFVPKITNTSDGKLTVEAGRSRSTGTWHVTGTSLEEQVVPRPPTPGSTKLGTIVKISPTHMLIMWKDGTYSDRYRSKKFKE